MAGQKANPGARLFFPVLAIVFVLSSATGCEQAIRNVVYDAYEQFGIHKRDLLKNRVDDVKGEQKEASEEFQDALQNLKQITAFDGGELEARYNDLKKSYDRSYAEAQDVRQSIRDIERVAGDLFKEWESEIPKISTPSLRQDSRRKLRETQKRYETLHSTLKKSESRLDPVLEKFEDQVLYLKHNLNAQAIGSLRSEVSTMQTEIQTLIEQMNSSMAQADQFARALP